MRNCGLGRVWAGFEALWKDKFASLPTVVIVLALDAVYLTENVILRTLMLKRAGSLHNFFDPFRAARTEIIWVALFSVIIIILGSVGGAFFRRLAPKLYACMIVLALLSIFVHFSVFAVTGTGLTADYILHWVGNTGDVNKMIAKEARAGTLIPIALQLALIFFAFRIPRLKFVKKWLAAAAAREGRNRVAAWVLILATLCAGGILLPPLGIEVNDALYAVPVFEVLDTFVKKAEEPMSLEMKPEERIDAPIRLAYRREAPRPNIVIIAFESLCWKYSDVYKPGLGTTPFLKEIAAKSLVVDKLYAVVPHTTKALVALLGGFYPYLSMDADEVIPGILPKRSSAYLLRQAGYRTAFFQTAGNYEERSQLIANLGFETFRDLDTLPTEGFADVNYFGKEERAMLGPSLDWIAEGKDQPFLLAYLTLSTHHNYGTPPDFPIKDYGTSDPILNSYLNAARFTDGFIKDLIGEFEKRGLMKNTVFIILGDHGEAFGEHGLRGHNFTMWEEGMRVLGLVYGPGVLPKAGRITGLRSTLDITPTVCDIAGLEPVEGKFAGQSLLQPVPDSRRLFFSGWSKNRVLAIKEKNFKYIAWPLLGRSEVYRVDSDPEEKNDLARAGRVPDIVLRARLDEMTRWASVVNSQYASWKARIEAETAASEAAAKAAAKTAAGVPADGPAPAR